MPRVLRAPSVALFCAAVVVGLVGVAAVPVGAGLTAPEIPLAWERVGTARYHASSPAIGDVNGDGVAEIVIGDLDGWVHVYDRNGHELAGWPQQVKPNGVSRTAVEATPTIADLDNDGKAEIIVGAQSTWVPNQHGGLVVFNRDGSVRWRWQGADEFVVWGMLAHKDGYTEGVYSTPAVGDIDGDGFDDIVFGSWDLRIHALDRHGANLPGFPMWQDDTVWSSPALFDVDGDGRLEIFIGGDSSAGGSEPHDGGVIRALDWHGGAVRHIWKRTFDDVVGGSPAIGDINGDGRLELVTTTGRFFGGADSERVYAIHLDDGSNVAGWPVQTGSANLGSVALGDITHDDGGNPEVVLGSQNGLVYAFRGDGRIHMAKAPNFAGEGGGEIVSTPIVADVDGNGINDVVIGNGWATFVLRGTDGARVREPIGKGWTAQNSAAVAKFGASGWMLVTATLRGGPNVAESAPGSDGRIAAYKIATPAKSVPWPQWRKNARHLGANPSGGNPLPPNQCYPNVNPPAKPMASASNGYWLLGVDGSVDALGGAKHHGSLATIGVHKRAVGISPSSGGKGYYILTDDGSIYPFGDAKSHGSMAGRPLNAPIIALAASPSGNGYWLLGADGGVFTFGDAAFWGSTGNLALNAPIISMTPTPTGSGYWLLASDGGVFSFGDARFFGSTGNLVLNSPIISMAANPAGPGYWLLGRDGGVFSFGVAFQGSVPGIGLCDTPLGMQIRPTRSGAGYFVAAADGRVFAFGEAPHGGNAAGKSLFNFVVDMALVP